MNPREHDGHNRGSLAKCFLQIVKTSCLDREEGDPSIESFDITFSSWIDILWKDLSDFRKLKSLESMYTKDIVRGWAIENSAFEDIEDFRVQVLNCISPDLQMIGLYLENAYREVSCRPMTNLQGTWLG